MQTANYPVIDGVPDCLATHNARKLYGSSLAHSGLSSVADGGLPHETGEPPWSCRCGAGRCWTARTGVGRGRQSPKAAHRLSVAGGEVEMLKGVHITNSKRPVISPGDLNGLKLRLPQSPAMLAWFRALGADASPLPFPQLYGALQAGVFGGQENPIAAIISAKFGQVQKFLTMS